MLLDSLKRKQQELGLSDREFAERLGVPRVTWTCTRLGYKRIGETMLVAAARAFPELEQDVLLFLRRKEPIGSNTEPRGAPRWSQGSVSLHAGRTRLLRVHHRC